MLNNALSTLKKAKRQNKNTMIVLIFTELFVIIKV